MELKINDISDFIEKVRIEIASYNKAKIKFYTKLSPEFSIFSLFKQNEMSVSRCMAFLLNPNENHAQSHLFLHYFYNKFLSDYQKPDKISCLLEKSINIGRKNDTDLRRLDIYIETDELLIGIENKPWAADSKDQLNNYAEWLSQQADKKGKDWKLIYLSPSEYSEESLSKKNKKKYHGNILHLTFYEIKAWLDDTSPFIKSTPVKVFVESFSDYINKSINMETSMGLSEDIIELTIRNNKNINAAIVIAKNISSIKTAIMNNFLTVIKNNLPHDIKVNFDANAFKSEKANCGFYIVFSGKDKYQLVFSFDYSRLNYFFWGLEYQGDTLLTRKTKNHNAIIENMNKIFPQYAEYTGEDNAMYPWWCEAEDTLEFPNNWNEDDSVWEKLQHTGSESLAAKVINIINKMNKHFDFELLK
ncbi:TPA: PD-(D/E)XK nuclease family protein [Morganella morganii]|nr:PD-(D/E)XK nuclease family protein [Morganella morganii]